MKIPSPCIDVCKFKHAGHCIGCGMTKKQKKKFKRLKGRKAKRQFIEALRTQQLEVGLKANWERAYRRRCEKKGVECPLDRVPVPDEPAPLTGGETRPMSSAVTPNAFSCRAVQP